eukprot:scaffold6.g2575.t1
MTQQSWEGVESLAGLVQHLHLGDQHAAKAQHQWQALPAAGGLPMGPGPPAGINGMNGLAAMVAVPAHGALPLNGHALNGHALNGHVALAAVGLPSLNGHALGGHAAPAAGPHHQTDPAAAAGYHAHGLAPAAPLHSMGWGGQAIADNSTFRAPWFGRSRGGGGPGRGAGAGTGARAGRGGATRRGGRRGWGAGDGPGAQEVSVEGVVAAVAGLPADQPIDSNVYQALFQLDGRAAALLVKELAKGGMQHRRGGGRGEGAGAAGAGAVELFDWIRALEAGHPLQSLLDVYSYTAMISLCIAEHNLTTEMKARGVERNVHTYTALMNVCIKCSKYGMALDTYKVMEVFQEMTYRGCERSVITYSSLISACEKACGAGQWELALELFQEMCREHCNPNTVTFNSLITALAQGAQWEKAGEVFEQMQRQGCAPDVVTYTALISAYEKGGQWRMAQSAYECMKAQTVLLMDRVMSTSVALAPDLADLLAVACVVIAARQVDGPPGGRGPLPPALDVEGALGLPAAAVEQMEWSLRGLLVQDTAAISTLRCLRLYLERQGGHHLDAAAAAALAGKAPNLVADSLTDMAFLNCRPSVIAAAVLYVERRARGIIPFWPSMLAKLTGYQDMSTPELSVAIKAAQRLAGRAGLAPHGGGHAHGGGGGLPVACAGSSGSSASSSGGTPSAASVLAGASASASTASSSRPGSGRASPLPGGGGGGLAAAAAAALPAAALPRACSEEQALLALQAAAAAAAALPGSGSFGAGAPATALAGVLPPEQHLAGRTQDTTEQMARPPQRPCARRARRR